MEVLRFRDFDMQGGKRSFGNPYEDRLEVIDFNPLIKKLEENKGRINLSERLENGVIAEKALNVLIDRGIRWCVKNSHMMWSPSLQIIRKKLIKNEKITIEEMALIKTINAALNPHKVNERFTRNHNLDSEETYRFYLNDLKMKNISW